MNKFHFFWQVLGVDVNIATLQNCPALCQKVQVLTFMKKSIIAVRLKTGMDRNAPEWAYITGMDIKIYLFYSTKFIILP